VTVDRYVAVDRPRALARTDADIAIEDTGDGSEITLSILALH
jgi:hypothetical protein